MIPKLPTENHRKCAALLEIVWRGIPKSYKRRYVREIWRQFQEEIETAAYTDNLAGFLNALCARFGATILTNAEAATVMKVLESGQDRAMLKLFRQESLYLATAIQVANQENREEWKARQAERETEEAEVDDPLFGLPLDVEEEEIDV